MVAIPASFPVYPHTASLNPSSNPPSARHARKTIFLADKTLYYSITAS